MKIQSVIYIEPTAKARARTKTVIKGKQKFTSSYTPESTTHAESMIRDHLVKLQQMFPPEVPLRLEIIFYRSRPKSLAKKHTLPFQRPDLDNYEKLFQDAAEKYIYPSDAQITTKMSKKRFGNPPRIEFLIEEDGQK